MFFASKSFIADKDVKIHVVAENVIGLQVPSKGGGLYLREDIFAPAVWIENDFLVLDVFHQTDDVMVIILKFHQRDSKFISVHYGILPNVKTRLCFPLAALNGEQLFLDRYPSVLQCVLRGDPSIDRTMISGLTITTIESIRGRKFELSNIHVRKDVPDFPVEVHPYIDKFGQLLERDWPEKMKTETEVTSYLQQQLEIVKKEDTEIGQFGGWKKLQFAATGFFRTEYDGENWWFVDPEGYALFSTGMDCVQPYDEMRISGMEQLISWLPEKDGEYHDAWSKNGYSYTVSNMIRTFGESWWEKWATLTETRLHNWKFNTIGNWSQQKFIHKAKLPYVYPLANFPTTEKKIYRDFPDVFSMEYEDNAKEFANQLLPLKDDKWLVGYFLRNEPHWAFVDQLNLTETMLQQPYPFVSKKRFVDWLMERYDSITELNTAWTSHYSSFADLLDVEKIQLSHSSNEKADINAFNRMLIQRYVEIPAGYCKKADPNHLNLGMRYAWVENDDILQGCEAFDVFSINSYSMKPNRAHIEYISKKLHRPVMIGEFHFGAADAGLLAYGIRALATQEERGNAYRYYVEQAAVIPELIGVHYFQYQDQPALGRFDGENYQIGFVNVCQKPYDQFIKHVTEAHENIYFIRTGEKEPNTIEVKQIPKTGF
nr:beta-galactosidase [Paenibacillus bovis]